RAAVRDLDGRVVETFDVPQAGRGQLPGQIAALPRVAHREGRLALLELSGTHFSDALDRRKLAADRIEIGHGHAADRQGDGGLLRTARGQQQRKRQKEMFHLEKYTLPPPLL